MKGKLNKLYSSSCRGVLVASLCVVAISSNAIAQEAGNFNQQIIQSAAGKTPKQISKMLKGIEVNSTASKNGATLLMEASEKGDTKLVKALIKEGADVNIKDLSGKTALQYAINSENVDTAKILVNNGADTSFLGAREAEFRAAMGKTVKPAVANAVKTPTGYKEIYADSGVKDFGDPLVNAAERGDLDKVKELLANGHSVDSTGRFSTTPLMRAAYRGNEEMLKYLIAQGANINMLDDGGKTAMSLAQLGKSEVAQNILLANGANAGLLAEPAAGPLLVAPLLGGLSAGTAAAVAGGTVAVAGAGVAIANANDSGSTATSTSTTSTPSSDGTGGTGGTGGGGTGGTGTPTHVTVFSDAEKNSTGGGVTVGIIGNGVYNSGTYKDGSHASGSAPENGDGTNTTSLANITRVWDSNSKDFYNPLDTGTNDGQPEGSGVMNGHDTENALIINQIATDSKILSARAFNAQGGIDPRKVKDAIDYVSGNGSTVINNTAKVINNSWGLIGGSSNMTDTPANVQNIAKNNLTGVIEDANGDAVPDPNGKVVDSIRNNLTNADTSKRSVFVWAAGNDAQSNPNITAGLYIIDPNLNQNATGTSGTANPDIAKYWLVAAAVKDNGNGSYDIASTGSNQCGLTQARCLVAVANSTSHAAAEVSGAAAKLVAAGLTTDQAASRILATAYYLDGSGHMVKTDRTTQTDSVIAATSAQVVQTGLDAAIREQVNADLANAAGASSVSNKIYGHGVLNSDLATSPLGSLFVKTGDGTSSLLSGSSIRLGKAFGDALANSNVKLSAFDNAGNTNSEFGSAKFEVPLVNLVGRDQTTIDLDESLSRLGKSQFATTTEFENGKLEFTPYDNSNANGQIISPEDQSKNVSGNFAYTNNIASSSFTVSHNVKMSQAFGFGAISSSGDYTSVSDASQKNPYLGFAEEGFNTIMKNNLAEDLSVKFGAFNGKETDKIGIYDRIALGGKEVSGTVGEATYSLGDTSVAVQAGSIIEKGAFLGSETSGAFATDSSTPTNFFGVSAQNNITDHLNVFGYYVAGKSTPTADTNSLFNNISDINSSAFSLGLSYNGFEKERDSILGFSVSQPLHVDKATASFAYDGSSRQVDLTPSGREMDLETYYNMKLGEGVSTTVSSMYRINPDNSQSYENESITLFTVRNKF